ncbi:hypothetical protein F4775DRAFT_590506 [Biscogniauxia sp. FL1348]|nr:hypothetical protein F4775DRAFT_590506 [Biscogniauxia sp. FL1348]
MTPDYPFHPDDFPINEDVEFEPTRVFYLKGCIHFKNTASILDLTGQVDETFEGDFDHAFLSAVSEAAQKLESSAATPAYRVGSSGDMMRTLKTVTDGATGARLCDLNMTFVSFDSSRVRFPAGSPHSRHDVEMCPVGGRAGVDGAPKHEAFVKNSIPYFWDMTASAGRVGVLYKSLNQTRVEIARVTGFGFDKDAVLVLDDRQLDDLVALTTCIVLLNGRDAMDF